MAFSEDWSKKGILSWKKNSEIMKQRLEYDKKFEIKKK